MTQRGEMGYSERLLFGEVVIEGVTSALDIRICTAALWAGQKW